MKSNGKNNSEALVHIKTAPIKVLTSTPSVFNFFKILLT